MHEKPCARSIADEHCTMCLDDTMTSSRTHVEVRHNHNSIHDTYFCRSTLVLHDGPVIAASHLVIPGKHPALRQD